MGLASGLLASDLGSPHGVTTNAKYVHHLWNITWLFAVPIAAIVAGLILWCVIRYRRKPGSDTAGSQFQYHIPIEAAYTIIPLVIVAIVFGFMFNAENKVNAVSKTPDLRIEVDGFQWGWSFKYPNGHQQIGTVANELNINSNSDLPVLVMPDEQDSAVPRGLSRRGPHLLRPGVPVPAGHDPGHRQHFRHQRHDARRLPRSVQ